MLTWVLLATVSLAPAQAPTEAFRLTAEAFGREAILEVHGPAREEAKNALSAALAEVRAVERLSDPEGSEPGGLGQLNRSAGAGMIEIDPRLGEILRRTANFCEWSQGAYGPLGGHLNQLWKQGLLSAGAADQATALSAAIAGSRCDLLKVDENGRRAELAQGARADLFGFAIGFAVDRAVSILGNYGIQNGTVALGTTARGFGPGADGRGWPVQLSELASQGNPEGALWLLDRAVAVAAFDDRTPSTGTPTAAYIHHRKGAPAEGVMAVLVSTELAVDSQGLASSLFVTGSRDGQMHLGALRPAPAVRWLLGRGFGDPLVVDYHWTDITRGRSATSGFSSP